MTELQIARPRVIIITSIYEYFSGGGVALFNSVLAIGRKYIVHVITSSDGTLYNALKFAGVKVSIINEYGKFDITYAARLYFKLKDEINRGAICITHSERTSVLVNPLFFMLRIRICTVLHRSIIAGPPWGKGIKSFLYGKAETLVLKYLTTKVLAVSKNLKRELTAERGLVEMKVGLLENYVDSFSLEMKRQISTFLKNDEGCIPIPSRQDFNIISIIRLNNVKGADFFNSEAFGKVLSYLTRKGIKRVAVYLILDRIDLNYFKMCSVMCKKANATICFLENISTIHNYLSVADLYIQPSRDEAFGLAAIEASFHNCAIVTTKIRSFIETFSSYKKFFPIINYDPDWWVDDFDHFDPCMEMRSTISVVKPNLCSWDFYEHDSSNHLAQFEDAMDGLK